MADDSRETVAARLADRPQASAPEDPTALIQSMRERIDEIDAAIIRLWRERAELSREIGMIRVTTGGTRLVLARDYEILKRFRTGIGADGTLLALLVLRAGRDGP